MNARSGSRIFACGTLLTLVACSPVPSRFPNLGIPMRGHEPDLSRVSITLDHSPGLGGSPSYEVRLFGTGRGTYAGRCCSVVTEGTVDITFNPKELFPVLDVLELMDFPRISHQCHWGRSENDMPIASVGLTVDGRTTTFHSCVPLPSMACESADLTRLHARFDSVVAAIDSLDGIQRLVGTPDEVQEHMRIRWENERRRK